MRLFFISLIYSAFFLNASAIGVDNDQLKNPVQEAQAQAIMTQLRCLVCQNQSIVESDADLAHDLRLIVREKVKSGQTEKQILAFMTNRYGDWILLKPPFKAATFLLWLGPLILLLIGGILVFRFVRKKPAGDLQAPLSAEEEKRIIQILKESRE